MSAQTKKKPAMDKNISAEIVYLHPERRVDPDIWKERRTMLMRMDIVTISVSMSMNGLDHEVEDIVHIMQNNEPLFLKMLAKARAWRYADSVKAKAPNVVQLFEHESVQEREQRLHREQAKAKRAAKKAEKSPQDKNRVDALMALTGTGTSRKTTTL